MKLSLRTLTVISALLLAGCQKQAEAPVDSMVPRATIQLKDGTRVSGTVLSTNAQEVTVRDEKSTRTIDMTRVKAIEYEDPAHDFHTHPTESVITTKTFILPVGTQVAVRTEETIDSGRAVEGQTFAAEVARNVMDAAGDIVIPKGANAHIVIKSAIKGGKIKGTSDLLIDLKTVSIDGRTYQIHTADIYEKGRPGVGMNKRTAEFTGIGAGIGAVIGAIAGHGKGAAIGAGSGAGAGALTQIITRGPSIKIPAESILTFRLDHEFRVSPAR